MKVKKNDWLVKITYVTEDFKYVVKYINFPNSTKREIIRYTQNLPENSIVHIYKFEAIF